MKIYLWPGGEWLPVGDSDDDLDNWRGDDFATVEVPDEVEDIDEWVEKERPHDGN